MELKDEPMHFQFLHIMVIIYSSYNLNIFFNVGKLTILEHSCHPLLFYYSLDFILQLNIKSMRALMVSQ